MSTQNPFWILDGISYQNRTAYSYGTPQVQSFTSSITTSRSSLTDYSLSFSLGSSEIIGSATYALRSPDGFSVSGSLRSVYKGSFAYSPEGRLTSISILSSTTWTHFTDGSTATDVINKLSAKTPYVIASDKIEPLKIAMEDLTKTGTFLFSHVGSGESYFENGRLMPNSNTLAEFKSLAEYSYYGDSWWRSPLTLPTQPTLAPSNGSSSGGPGAETGLVLSGNYDLGAILSSIVGSTQSGSFQIDITGKTLAINASSWTGSITINFAGKASDSGQKIDAKQIDINASSPAGSILQGGSGNDQLWGKAGWDIFDGGAGNDLIRAGNGRDIITGGLGADELHGDFGWNTFKSEQDGYSDLIAIKSDQFLSNWIYGKAGNNPNGEKADIIEGLDANDQIKIIGVFSPDISVRAGASAHGVSGIGIYAGGALEALYTGTNLSVAQITAMTTGDGSAAAMANQISSYGWTGV